MGRKSDARQAQAAPDDAGLRLRMRGEEHRIHAQHEKLDVWCREIYALLGKNGARSAMNDFLLFQQAFEAHMTVEEEVYFPAFHGLRADLADELADLVTDHVDLRTGLAAVKAALKAGQADVAGRALEGLARSIDRHESDEEEMIARINAGPLMETSGASL